MSGFASGGTHACVFHARPMAARMPRRMWLYSHSSLLHALACVAPSAPLTACLPLGACRCSGSAGQAHAFTRAASLSALLTAGMPSCAPPLLRLCWEQSRRTTRTTTQTPKRAGPRRTAPSRRRHWSARPPARQATARPARQTARPTQARPGGSRSPARNEDGARRGMPGGALGCTCGVVVRVGVVLA